MSNEVNVAQQCIRRVHCASPLGEAIWPAHIRTDKQVNDLWPVSPKTDLLGGIGNEDVFDTMGTPILNRKALSSSHIYTTLIGTTKYSRY